ncbi:hypothetical protein ABT160_08150 [Streptomyces sp. NPDC001941]|uniref:hypothetical protein n=1 Tax=Streptomyces sp. NPDC001941 TaxID=3154659 RepID=UPI00332772B6
MSIVTPSSTASASEPEGNSRTALAPGSAPAPAITPADTHATTSSPAPAPAPSAASRAAVSLPLTNPGVDVIEVAEIRRKAMLDALDPGPRPGSAARPSRRSLLSKLKGFYAQELTHDVRKPEHNG